MKKIVLSLFALISFCSLSAAEDLSKDKYIKFYLTWDSAYLAGPGELYYINYEGDFYNSQDRNQMRLDENGYFYFNDKIFIPGKQNVYFDGELKNDPEAEEYSFYYNSAYGVDYKASSELSEKTKNGTVNYSAENLATFAFSATNHYESLSWNFNHVPWVEGEKGYGIGTKISLHSEESFGQVLILNGYVDIKRPDLYRKNSRVKKFKVCDLDNSEEYIFELEDCVCFQIFTLNYQTKNLSLEILDVYKGDKYDDTCVSAIVPESKSASDGDSSYEQTYSCFLPKPEAEEQIYGLSICYKYKEFEQDNDK